jgi:hypothetical protein
MLDSTTHAAVRDDASLSLPLLDSTNTAAATPRAGRPLRRPPRLPHARPLFLPSSVPLVPPPHQIDCRRPKLANERGASAQESWRRGGLTRWRARAPPGRCEALPRVRLTALRPCPRLFGGAIFTPARGVPATRTSRQLTGDQVKSMSKFNIHAARPGCFISQDGIYVGDCIEARPLAVIGVE